MPRTRTLWTASLIALSCVSTLGAQGVTPAGAGTCGKWASDRRNPTASELRCQYGVPGYGRFGLLSYLDVPVYQPTTPLPGTHVVGVAGLPKPDSGETYEAWEWRLLRTRFGPEAMRVYRGMELLDPFFSSRLLVFERRLAEAGIHAYRRETWRSPERQAFLFQQGRSRPGPLATATLTSWHSRLDEQGKPAGRAADYNVSARSMRRFHEIAEEVGLSGYGAESNDPGHVFLPGGETLPDTEVILLRLLPRVPHVTLATGRPVDEITRRGFAELRREALAWISQPIPQDYATQFLEALRRGPPRR